VADVVDGVPDHKAIADFRKDNGLAVPPPLLVK
jgi:hypothetical protein